MDFGKKQTLLLFLDKNRFDLYSSAQNTVFRFDLSPFVSNFEPKNIPEFEQQFYNFISQNKILSGNIIILLSERSLFVKGFPPGLENEEEQIKKFTDSVPFENVQSLVYPIEGGKLIVTANREYYLFLKNVFEKLGFSIILVLPIYSIKLQLDQDAGLDENVSRLILRQPDLLKQPNFEKVDNNATKTKPTDLKHPKKIEKRLFVLLGVFGVLITVLIFVVINSLTSSPPQTKSTPALITPAQTKSESFINPTLTPLQSSQTTSESTASGTPKL